MGYMRHHAILVTTYSEDRANEAYAEAQRIFTANPPPGFHSWTPISPLQEAPVNGYWSFVIFPDGSKEGWPQSDWMDDRRVDLVEWLRQQYTEDGGSYYDWVEVQYGDDDCETDIVASSDYDKESVAWDRKMAITRPCSEEQ